MPFVHLDRHARVGPRRESAATSGTPIHAMSTQNQGGHANYRRRKRSKMHAEAEAEAAELASIDAHPMLVSGRPELIQDSADLDSLVSHLRETGSFAYDTEFIGEETFLPRICLVQVATPERLALIDPVGVPDLRPVFELVADPGIETLVHDGAQDLEPVRRMLDREPGGIVDTQVCAAFLDMPWPTSLAKLIERFTGHQLSKGHTFTDWDARPLTDRQIRYAADDVRFLPLAWSRMKAELEDGGRMDWALRECDESRRRHVGRFDAEKQVRRIVKGSRAKTRTVTVLMALVELRHEIAREMDLPHRVAISDDALNDLARSAPTDPDGVIACRNVSRRTGVEHGARIAAAVQAALDGPPRPLSGGKTREETAQDRMRIDALWSILSLRCLADRIAPSLMTSRADLGGWYLDRVAGRTRDPMFPEGSWRAEAAGAWLEAFLRGDTRLELRWQDGSVERTRD